MGWGAGGLGWYTLFDRCVVASCVLVPWILESIMGIVGLIWARGIM